MVSHVNWFRPGVVLSSLHEGSADVATEQDELFAHNDEEQDHGSDSACSRGVAAQLILVRVLEAVRADASFGLDGFLLKPLEFCWITACVLVPVGNFTGADPLLLDRVCLDAAGENKLKTIVNLLHH